MKTLFELKKIINSLALATFRNEKILIILTNKFFYNEIELPFIQHLVKHLREKNKFFDSIILLLIF